MPNPSPRADAGGISPWPCTVRARRLAQTLDFLMAYLLFKVDSSRTTLWLYALTRAIHVTASAGLQLLMQSHSV